MPTVDVYADVLFLINFGMDALCLIMTARCLHRRIAMLRLLTAAALGGIYGVVVLFWTLSAPFSFFVDVLVCILMCFLVMGGHRLWLTGGLYLLTSMVMGGVMTALYHWLNRVGFAEILPHGEEGVTSVAFVLLAGMGWGLTLIWGRVFRKSESRKAKQVTLSVMIDRHTLHLTGMIDSGNLLEDPLSGLPVIVVRRTTVESFLSEELRSFFKTQTTMSEIPEQLPEKHRLHLIPTHTATGQGLLWGIRPDDLILCGEDLKHPIRVKALICPTDLAGAPADALVPSNLLP